LFKRGASQEDGGATAGRRGAGLGRDGGREEGTGGREGVNFVQVRVPVKRTMLLLLVAVEQA